MIAYFVERVGWTLVVIYFVARGGWTIVVLGVGSRVLSRTDRMVCVINCYDFPSRMLLLERLREK